MNAAALDVGVLAQQWAGLVLLHGIRLTVLMLVLPATADEMMPRSVRVGFIAVFALYCSAGTRPDQLDVLLTGSALAVVVVREVAIGLTIGFAAAKLFWVAQSAGALIDNLSGYNNVQLNNPTSTEQSTPVANLLTMLASAVFFISGGMTFLLAAVIETYRWWPLLQESPTWPRWPTGMAEAEMDTLMRLTASVAGPALFMLALVEVAMAVLSRSAKNLDSSSISTPLRAAGALLALVFFASLFVSEAKAHLSLSSLSSWLSVWRADP